MAVRFIPFVFPGVEGVRCAFQIRTDPDPYADTLSWTGCSDRSAAIANRREFARQCGLDGFAELHQVHGIDMVFDPPVLAAETAPIQEGDGLATNRERIGLLIKTADCQPVLLAHRSGSYIAALHVGWRGNRQDFITLGVKAFCGRYKIEPYDVFAVRGPSLGPAAAEFTGFEKEWGETYLPWFDARNRTMDLWRLSQDQLLGTGIPRSQIFGLDLCTWSLPDAFFSFRRSRSCGRQGSVVWIEGK